jgi:hypothetical protein
VLTDEQIAAMSPEQRRDLITRLSRPADEILPSRRTLRWVREFRIVLMVGSVAVLVPWTAYLGVTLPRLYVAHNWDLTWVGFDILLVVMMTATGVLGFLRRQLLGPAAFATGVLLICDAWFDVMTAHGEDKMVSILTALLVELPLAAVLIAGSLQVLRLTAARLWYLDSGQHSWQVRIPVPSQADRAVSGNGRRFGAGFR